MWISSLTPPCRPKINALLNTVAPHDGESKLPDLVGSRRPDPPWLGRTRTESGSSQTGPDGRLAVAVTKVVALASVRPKSTISTGPCPPPHFGDVFDSGKKVECVKDVSVVCDVRPRTSGCET